MSRKIILFSILLSACASPGIFFSEYPGQELSQRILLPDPAENLHSAIPDKLSIPVTIDMALSRSPILQQAKAQQAMAIADRKSAFSMFLPQVSGTYAYDTMARTPGIVLDNPFFPPSPSSEKRFKKLEIEAKMVLWDFGKTLGQYRQASFQEEITEFALLQKKQEVVYGALEAYFRLLNARKQRQVILKSLETAKAHLRMAQSFFRQDVVDQNDVLKADLQVAQLEQQSLKMKHGEEMAGAYLNRQIGAPIHRVLEIEDYVKLPGENISLAEALRQAVAHRPEFQIIKKSIRLAEYGYTTAWASHLPTFYVGGKYQWSDNDYLKYFGNSRIRSDNWVAEIGIQMELFSGGRALAQTEKAKNKIQESIGKAKEVCDLIALEVKDAVLSLQEARESVSIAQRAIAQANENVRLIEQKYKAQIVTSTDVVDAENLLTHAQQSFHAAVYGYWIARARLQKATGRSIEDQKKSLSTPTS